MNTHARGLLVRGFSMLIVGALLAYVGYVIWRDMQQVAWDELRFDWSFLLAAAVVFAVAYLLRAILWTCLARELGAVVSMTQGARLFLGSQLGRYLPGKIWQFAGVGLLAQREGVAVGACVMASAITVLLHHLVGIGIGVMAFAQFLVGEQLTLILVLSSGIVVLVLLKSRPAAWLLDWVAAKIGRKIHFATHSLPSWLSLALYSLGFGVIWCLFGCALFLVNAAVVATIPSVLETIPIMSAACVVGFIMLPAPSGLGVREAMLVLLLGPSMGEGLAGIAALLLRVIMTMVELPLGAWGTLSIMGSLPRRHSSSVT